MQIDIEGLKHNRIMARARGNYELYLLVRQMVNELNQGIKRFVSITQKAEDDIILGYLNGQKNTRIECHSVTRLREQGKDIQVLHTIVFNSIK